MLKKNFEYFPGFLQLNIWWVLEKSKHYLGTIIYLPAVNSNSIDCSLYSLIVVILGFLFLSKTSKWHSPSSSFQTDIIDFLNFSFVGMRLFKKSVLKGYTSPGMQRWSGWPREMKTQASFLISIRYWGFSDQSLLDLSVLESGVPPEFASVQAPWNL